MRVLSERGTLEGGLVCRGGRENLGLPEERRSRRKLIKNIAKDPRLMGTWGGRVGTSRPPPMGKKLNSKFKL